ncbi:isopentenyl-diphosphate delta-isomerase [Tessaracoccus flavus]|nr:isopentenyl-diphosphate Delta-isomerase [Tessaracoccus flavus]SDY76307.1 isopentenyl-diphosphate delta-isomerase [Tessaracoccus flavus]
MTTTVTADEVILLSDDGQPIGRADRTQVHTADTPLHLAFSTYLFNERGEVLLTRRALSKKTWGGVWTNSCCGHPKPEESFDDAAHRRVEEELGLTIGPLTPLVPNFRYRAVDASGIVENEICPVFGAVVEGDPTPRPDPDEVAEWAWVPWESFVAAISATPAVYSPWAVRQVPLIGRAHPSASMGVSASVDVERALTDVEALLKNEMAGLADEWTRYAGNVGLDVLAADLPKWAADLLIGRGKRFRVTMAYWAFIAAGGRTGSPGYRNLVRAAAALELLHLFALIHDDVMDESSSRRGRPAAHVEAAARHRATGAYGNGELFGRNVAILLGDLAHVLADRLIDGLPEEMREVWYALSVELIAGQRADLTGAAAGRRDLAHAKHVAQVKSGRYTVARPMQLGAAAAMAPAGVVDTLMAFGDHIGRAFALRDDVLGVWGDPAVTGKPAGDDLYEAKATVLLSLAGQRLQGDAAALLQRVGTPGFSRADVASLAAAMRRAGVHEDVERMITEAVDAALVELHTRPLVGEGVEGLRTAARAVAWRDA